MITVAPQLSRIVKPRTTAPTLDVPLAGGGRFRLADERPGTFTLIVFYRGLHCPICRRQLEELQRRLDDFQDRGVTIVAVSGDTAERAQQALGTWAIERLRVGYDLPKSSMREWGLFLSRGLRETDPDVFSEPGLFLIAPDATVYFEAIQSAPFARPALSDLLAGLDYVAANDYPARGEL